MRALEGEEKEKGAEGIFEEIMFQLLKLNEDY